MDIMQLGGNIELAGFNEVDRAQMVVLKKIIGTFVKEYSEKAKVEKLVVSMNKEGEEYKVTVDLSGDKPFKSENKSKNLFFALGNVLEDIKKQL